MVVSYSVVGLFSKPRSFPLLWAQLVLSWLDTSLLGRDAAHNEGQGQHHSEHDRGECPGLCLVSQGVEPDMAARAAATSWLWTSADVSLA